MHLQIAKVCSNGEITDFKRKCARRKAYQLIKVLVTSTNFNVDVFAKLKPVKKGNWSVQCS